jgi:hypothetical protein
MSYDLSHKIYECRHQQFKFVCTKCGFTKTINTEKYIRIRNAPKIRIKCKCGETQTAYLERRNTTRKASEFEGKFFHSDRNGNLNSGDITIQNISADGMGFTLLENLKHSIKPGDDIIIKFKANHMPRSLITKKASVRNIQGNFLNVKFDNEIKTKNEFYFKILMYG